MRLSSNSLLTGGFALVLLAAFLVQLVEGQSSETFGRNPASLSSDLKAKMNSVNPVFPKIKANQILLFSDSRIPDREAFQFGELRGEFRLWIDPQRNGRVWKLERLTSSETLFDWPDLLERNAALFAVDFSRVMSQENGEELQLLDRSGQARGVARIHRSTEGQIQSLELQSL